MSTKKVLSMGFFFLLLLSSLRATADADMNVLSAENAEISKVPYVPTGGLGQK